MVYSFQIVVYAINMNSVKLEDTYSAFSEENRGKRTRCSNFTAQEKNVLIHIVEKYEATVESKKTDKLSVMKKEKVWDTIAEEFNEILGAEKFRTSKQLKICYDNFKKRQKKLGTDQSDVFSPVKPQNPAVNERCHDSDLESNYSADSNSVLVTESYVPGDKLSRLRAQPKDLDDAASAPEPGEIPDGPGALTKLRQILLKKEIALVDLDLQMRTKKYELELRVQEAKLEYYQRKTALLTHVPNGDA